MSDWNGLPQNPELDGWHWLRCNLHAKYEPQPWFWCAAGCGAWQDQDGDSPAIDQNEYLGPITPPAELARLRAELAEAQDDAEKHLERGAQNAVECARLREIITAAFEAIRDREDNGARAYLILRDAAMAFPSVPQAPPVR
jgi:hypothetical protein